MFLLPKGNPLFENLAIAKLKLPDVLAKLCNAELTGYASFVFPQGSAILVFAEGKLVSAHMEWRDRKRELDSEALSSLTELMVTTGSGALNVYKLSGDLTICIQALLGGEALYKAQALKLIDIKALLEKVKEDQMNGCLRIYTDEHSAMIFYKDGNPLGFFHDESSDIETSSTESQKIAGLPGAKMDLFSTQSPHELLQTDLFEITDVEKIWDECVDRHKSEIDKTNSERQEHDREIVLQKLAELEEQVKIVVSEYVGRVGRGIVDKEISDNGGNSCLIYGDRSERFMKGVERAAKLLVSGTNIKLMMDKLSSLILPEKSNF